MSSDSTCTSQPDSDISGVGVRISFYCQVFLYGVLVCFRDSASTKPKSKEGEEKREDASSALSTLILTNVAMQITAFITSFKKQVSLPEGLVVIYLLALSSPCILLSLPAPRKPEHRNLHQRDTDSVATEHDSLKGGNEETEIACGLSHALEDVESLEDRLSIDTGHANTEQPRSTDIFQNLLHYFALFQSYTFSAYNLYLVFTTSSFGSNPECNSQAKVSLFACIPARGAGLVFAQVIAVLVIVVKTAFFLNDFRRTTQKTSKTGNKFFKPLVNKTGRYRSAIKGAIVFVVWLLAVINTEVLISCNGLGGQGTAQWGFGQILPMILLFDPLYDVLGHVWKLPWTKRNIGRLCKLFRL